MLLNLFVRKIPFLQLSENWNHCHALKKSFDCENQKYNIISNLSECANELMISEKMLGYIFAMMEEYAPTFNFGGNSCTINY